MVMCAWSIVITTGPRHIRFTLPKIRLSMPRPHLIASQEVVKRESTS